MNVTFFLLITPPVLYMWCSEGDRELLNTLGGCREPGHS